MTFRRALITLLASAALAALAGAATPPEAAAAQAPCWKQLLNDWYDGRIDNAYQVHCYREAIRNLPDDVDAYTEAREDIQRALLAAIRASGDGRLDPTDVIPPEPSTDGDGSPGNGDPGSEDEPTETTAGPFDPDEDGGIIGFFRPSNADEVPLPLLVLAGLALLLLAAASAGFVARRIQARRPGPPALPNRPPPPES